MTSQQWEDAYYAAVDREFAERIYARCDTEDRGEMDALCAPPTPGDRLPLTRDDIPDLSIGAGDYLGYFLPGATGKWWGIVEVARGDGQLLVRSWNGTLRWIWAGNVTDVLKAGALDTEAAQSVEADYAAE